MQRHNGGASPQPYSYPLQNVPAGQRDLVEELMVKFTGEATIVQETATDEYLIQSPRVFTELQLQKVQQLCRLNAKEKQPQPNKNAPEEDSESIVNEEPQRPGPAAPPPKNKPDTLRVKNIPKSYTKDQVAAQISKTFRSVAKVHSLAATNSDFNCATVTFPYEKDYDFPNLQLERIRLDRNSISDHPFEYDTEFKSLTPIYDAGEDANVDIVAIVGLGSHPFATFRSPEPKSDGMWLRDYLPEDIKNIRVVLYGYPSQVDASKSVETIEHIARTLLNRLTNFRRATSTQNRPLIFLGQSLGGLIIQECIVLADPESRGPGNLDTEATMIFSSWCGLVGFGIPIGGLNNPSLREAVQYQPNRIMMEQICLNEAGEASDYLKDLRVRFEVCRQRRSQKYQPRILYFWERLYSKPRLRAGIISESVLMVPEDASTPGAVNLGLHSDHSGMVKYKGKADDLYEDVRDNMDTMIRHIVGSQQTSKQTQPNNITSGHKTEKTHRKPRRKGKGYVGDNNEYD